MPSTLRRHGRVLLLIVGVVAALAATTAALTGLPSDLQDLVQEQVGADGEGAGAPDVDLVGLDLEPRGHHAASVDVALTSDEAVEGLALRIQALDEDGGVVEEATVGPVALPVTGTWSGTVHLTAPDLTRDLETVQVAVGDGDHVATLP